MLPRAKVTSNSTAFSEKDVQWDSLLESLGGREILELMIEASGFSSLRSEGLGLRFQFKYPGRNSIHIAQLVPWYRYATSPGINPIYYVRIVIETIMSPAPNQIMAYSPHTLVPSFELLTNLSISFP
jgi:hypothetical protein